MSKLVRRFLDLDIWTKGTVLLMFLGFYMGVGAVALALLAELDGLDALAGDQDPSDAALEPFDLDLARQGLADAVLLVAGHTQNKKLHKRNLAFGKFPDRINAKNSKEAA